MGTVCGYIIHQVNCDRVTCNDVETKLDESIRKFAAMSQDQDIEREGEQGRRRGDQRSKRGYNDDGAVGVHLGPECWAWT
jgi:hypothetical protein